jgi:pimeloyl-ACP methyl ester carboxylesterase
MPEAQPTVVLVHGAFADAGSYATVVPELLADGLSVVVPANPNRGLIFDSAYIASVIRQIDGPVVLVGHSYGGAVITVAGVEDNVKALVYLSAYCPEEGENLNDLQGRFPDSPLAKALVFKSYPTDGEPGTDVYVDVAKFPEIFAADVDPGLAKILAVGQRPLSALAFTDKASAAAWKTRPAWGSVASNDLCINPDVERFGYKRGGVTSIEIPSSHLVMLSHPKEVADLIRTAIAGS